jgi:hypothetical protein
MCIYFWERALKNWILFLFPDRDFFSGAPECVCLFYPRTRERTRVTDPFLSVCVFVNFTGRVREILRPVVRGMRSLSLFVFGWRFEILLFLFFLRASRRHLFFLSASNKKSLQRRAVVVLLRRRRRMRRYDGLFRSMIALAIFADVYYLYRSFLEHA